MTLTSKLVSRTGARVICGYASRLPRGRGFRLVIRPADTLIYEEQQALSVLGLNRSVEEVVKMDVAQYQWEYKRFKRQPDGSHFYRVQ